jgi:hypothetical protein
MTFGQSHERNPRFIATFWESARWHTVLLMVQLRQGRAKEWALHRLMTIGEACRVMLKEALRTTLTWAIEQVTERELSVEHVTDQLHMI